MITSYANGELSQHPELKSVVRKGDQIHNCGMPASATPDEASPMNVVFIHGGVHHGGCWDDTIAEILRLDGTIRCLAVDLPGRRANPGDLASLTIEDCVSNVVDQIETWVGSSPPGRLALVGHSLAGITIPGVASRLSPHGLDQVIFVACCVPPFGQCVLDTLPLGLKPISRRIISRSKVIQRVPAPVLRFFFGNAASHRQRETMMANICPESSALITEPITTLLPGDLRKAWVIPTRDRAMPPARQRRWIANMGGVDQLRTIDASHELMFTHPAELAAVLVELLQDQPIADSKTS